MKVNVTQEDKDASAELAVAIGMSAEDFTSGAADVIVRAFACHRHETEAAGRAEIEALRSYIVECDENAAAEWDALRGALATIIADPDCCAASKAIARDALNCRAASPTPEQELLHALSVAVRLLWDHCEGIAPRIEPLEEILNKHSRND